MKKFLLAVLACGLVPTLAIADPVPPSFVSIKTATAGHYVNDTIPITVDNKTLYFALIGCQLEWRDNEPFYMLTTHDALPLLAQKSLMDSTWDATHDWDKTILGLKAQGKLCLAVPSVGIAS